MKCWPLDLRHQQRDSDFSAGFGRNGDPAYTLTSAQTGGGNIPAVAVIHDNCGKSLEVCAETAPCLTCQQDKHPWSVIHEAYPLDLRNALRDADRESRTGVGFGEAGDPANTVTQGAVPAVACVDVWASTPTIDETGAPTMRRCTRLVRHREREREEMDEPQYVVRRITPVEAERLQGFPDGWTDIEYNGRPAPDTARYRALGNSMTVSVMKWLAQRILEADKDDNETNTRV